MINSWLQSLTISGVVTPPPVTTQPPQPPTQPPTQPPSQPPSQPPTQPPVTKTLPPVTGGPLPTTKTGGVKLGIGMSIMFIYAPFLNIYFTIFAKT